MSYEFEIAWMFLFGHSDILKNCHSFSILCFFFKYSSARDSEFHMDMVQK